MWACTQCSNERTYLETGTEEPMNKQAAFWILCHAPKCANAPWIGGYRWKHYRLHVWKRNARLTIPLPSAPRQEMMGVAA